jgi:hypothetical protein
LERRGADLECIYPLICWMDTPEKRARIDAALGAVVAVDSMLGADPDAARGVADGAFQELITPTFDLRACLGSLAKATEVTPENGGAVALVLESLANDPAALATLRFADLGIIADWLADARCIPLALEHGLETGGRGGPSIPDLPPVEIEDPEIDIKIFEREGVFPDDSPDPYEP